MSVGDQEDFVSRIRMVLPNGWFRDSTPILDGLLNGIAWVLARVFSLIGYARLQTRILTATDAFLDLTSFDFFGTTLPRKTGETDAAFRVRIQAALLLERGTRSGLVNVLTLLTGNAPRVFEPARPADTGAYNTNTMGYNVAGGYGSLQLPYQTFVIAYRPVGQGIPYIAGYGNPRGAYNVGGQAEYVNPGMVSGVTDADILNAIDSVKPVGTVVWTAIENPQPAGTQPAIGLEGGGYLLTESGAKILI